VEAAPRIGAHAAQQRSCSSLTPGIGWRRSAYEPGTFLAKIMRIAHNLGLDLVVA
jgi:hypothetical protein